MPVMPRCRAASISVSMRMPATPLPCHSSSMAMANSHSLPVGPAMALGVDRADGDAMRHRPRPGDERILTRSRWVAVALSAAVMALGTLAVLQWAPEAGLEAGVPSIAGTMAFHTFVMFQFFNILSARHDTRSVFSRDTFANRWLWIALAGVALLQYSVSHLGVMQRLFDTVAISAGQWLVCLLVATTVLWAEEARKLIVRARARRLSYPTNPQQKGI